MSLHPRSLFPSVTLVIFAIPAVHAQVVSPIPGTLYDLAAQFRLPGDFSLEQQIQTATQANSSSGNPFAYSHAVQVRPWFHYDGIRNTTLTASVSYIAYFNVPGTSNYSHPEWRITAIGTLKQPLTGGSLYEQVRFEFLNFRDSNGMTQHLPRLRFRLGQNLYLGEGRFKPYLGVYEEAIRQFPSPSYSGVRLEGARFFAGYGFELGPRTQVLLGFKAEGEVSSSGSTFTVYYGPAFSVEHTFTRRPLNEKHRRTTAFKDF